MREKLCGCHTAQLLVILVLPAAGLWAALGELFAALWPSCDRTWSRGGQETESSAPRTPMVFCPWFFPVHLILAVCGR